MALLHETEDLVSFNKHTIDGVVDEHKAVVATWRVNGKGVCVHFMLLLLFLVISLYWNKLICSCPTETNLVFHSSKKMTFLLNMVCHVPWTIVISTPGSIWKWFNNACKWSKNILILRFLIKKQCENTNRHQLI